MSILRKCNKCGKLGEQKSQFEYLEGWLKFILNVNGHAGINNKQYINKKIEYDICYDCLYTMSTDITKCDKETQEEIFTNALWKMVDEAVEDRLSQ